MRKARSTLNMFLIHTKDQDEKTVCRKKKVRTKFTDRDVQDIERLDSLER